MIPRTGVKPVLLLGMALCAVGMLLLTQLTPTSSYGTGVLPALLLIGVGTDGTAIGASNRWPVMVIVCVPSSRSSQRHDSQGQAGARSANPQMTNHGHP